MDNFQEDIYCKNCGHLWVLVSNKGITNEQRRLWVENFWKQHAQIREEREDKNV